MQASFSKYFILMCRFTMCESIGQGVGGGGEPKKERKRVGHNALFH